MSDINLHGVLNMPSELWTDCEASKMQRHSVYIEASKRIKELESKLDQAIDLLDDKEAAWLLSEFKKGDL